MKEFAFVVHMLCMLMMLEMMLVLLLMMWRWSGTTVRCRLGGFLRLARPEVIRRRLGRPPSPRQIGVALNQLTLFVFTSLDKTKTCKVQIREIEMM